LLFPCLQYESALAIDGVRAIYYALSKALKQSPSLFKVKTRDGRDYSNGVELLDCDADAVKPWKHGSEIMKYLREVCTSQQWSTNV